MKIKIDWTFETEEIEKKELSRIIYELLNELSLEEFVGFHQEWMKDFYLGWNDDYTDYIKKYTDIEVCNDEGDNKVRELFDDADFWDLSSEKYREFLGKKSPKDATCWLNGDYEDFWNEKKLDYLLNDEESDLTEEDTDEIYNDFYEVCGEYFSEWAFRHMLLDLLERNEGYFKKLKKQSKNKEIEFIV